MARKKTEDAEENGERAKQGHLPEMEPPSFPDIEEAAENYVRSRNKWQRAHQPMMEAQEILHGMMKTHGLRHYDFDGKIVEIVGSEKVKVKAAKEESDDED